ncbi:PP2C family serine/threonine-protein phosphatase, partial [Paraglaciecola sp.]
MPSQLIVSVGQYSDKGRKAVNQDFYGVMVPTEPQLSTKGIVAAIADGISSSEVSHIASESSVRSLLDDYYCTSETWSVKKSAERVLTANNTWLHSQTEKSEHRFDKNKGFVCTLSALIIKSNTAYTFHIGDSRIYHFRNGNGVSLTADHRTWVSSEQSYLSRAMGMFSQLELDHDSLTVEKGDVFILATDGVYECVDKNLMYQFVEKNAANLDEAAAK